MQLLKATWLLLMEQVVEPEFTVWNPISTPGEGPCAMHLC